MKACLLTVQLIILDPLLRDDTCHSGLGLLMPFSVIRQYPEEPSSSVCSLPSANIVPSPTSQGTH